MKKLEELGISPAPWSFVKSNRDYEVSDSEEFNLSYEDRYELPNARLIAAAPDLYDALQQIMQCWGSSVFDEGGMSCDTPLYCKHAGCGPDTCPVFLRAKSALAKAAGEETK